jgi:hypothetical protein
MGPAIKVLTSPSKKFDAYSSMKTNGIEPGQGT